MKLLLCAVVAILIFCSFTSSQTLKLKAGTTQTFNGKVGDDGESGVDISGKKGQSVSIVLTSRSKLVFQFYSVHSLFRVEDITHWEGTLPETNDYSIIVSGKPNSSYTLIIKVK